MNLTSLFIIALSCLGFTSAMFILRQRVHGERVEAAREPAHNQGPAYPESGHSTGD